MIATRIYGPRGWAALAAFAIVLFVVIPLLNLAVGPGSMFHVSAYWVTLLGKIMCYAIVALAMETHTHLHININNAKTQRKLIK